VVRRTRIVELSTGRTVRALPHRRLTLLRPSVAMLADDAGALLRALKIPSATVAGFSIGSGCSRLGMRWAVVSKPASTK
jgi:pimeloyl-ACP methyl ester carboxylesterase